MKEPVVVWIFGLPSAGKSTLAREIKNRMTEQGEPSLLLDGDDLRGGLCRGLGFSEEGRTENLRRAAEVSALSVRRGISAVAALITPLASQRALIANVLAGHRVFWVWACCPLEVCRSRDVKGLYRQQHKGALEGLTGVDASFEAPESGVICVDTSIHAISESADHIWRALLSS